jgi:hypothetical protein
VRVFRTQGRAYFLAPALKRALSAPPLSPRSRGAFVLPHHRVSSFRGLPPSATAPTKYLPRSGAQYSRGARQPVVFEAKPMTQNFIFAQDVILDPDTGKILAVVRNGEVWRDETKIAVLVGAQMYDLNGNLLGKLATGAGSLPISFKNLVEGKSAHAERALVA